MKGPRLGLCWTIIRKLARLVPGVAGAFGAMNLYRDLQARAVGADLAAVAAHAGPVGQAVAAELREPVARFQIEAGDPAGEPPAND